MQDYQKPGAVIGPHSSAEPTKEPEAPKKSVAEPETPVEEVVQSVPVANWQFNATDQNNPGPTGAPSETDIDVIQWSASEFVAHDKNSGWYLALVAGTLIIAGITYLLSKEFFTPSLIVICAILFGVMGARKPRELQYAVDERGIQVGNKLYPYSGFKSFSIVQEGGVESVWFMPLQRFMPSLSIYFAPADGQRIIDTLSEFLPVETHELDPIDRLMHKIRF